MIVRGWLVLGMACWAVAGVRGDWPHLRGPNLDATFAEPGLAKSWPEVGPPILWSRELGQGHSGFIVVQGKVYTQRQSFAGQTVLCLDPNTGETIWETRYDWAWQPHGAYPGPYGTPTWFKGKIYYTSPTGLIGCMDASNGEILWSYSIQEKFERRGDTFGYAISPLVEDDRVIVTVGGTQASLVALKADTGETLWQAGSDPASYCPPLPITFQGRRCVLGYLQNVLLLVDIASGEVLARLPLSTGYDEHSVWPIYREPYLLLTSPFRRDAISYELKPDPVGSLTLVQRWSKRDLANDVISSLLYKDHVYGFDLQQLQVSKSRPSRGLFKCLDWASGKVCWSSERVGQASVIAGNDMLYLLNDTGSLIIAKADPTAYHELARLDLFEGEICWTPPTLWQGKLFVRSPSRATCVYVGLGENVKTSPSPNSTRPTRRAWVKAEVLFTREREYPNDAPTWQEMLLWFAASLGLVFVGSAFLTVLIWPLTRSRYVYWVSAFVLGWLGPNVFSELLNEFLFTWPASLYAAFHTTLLINLEADQAERKRRARWLARLALLLFGLVLYTYFELCRTVGMFIGWGFLIGFPIALPFTYLAARTPHFIAKVVWTLLAFSAFYWSAWGFFLWKGNR